LEPAEQFDDLRLDTQVERRCGFVEHDEFGLERNGMGDRKALALLPESPMAISLVAEASGFASISHFHEHVKTACGMPPNAMPAQYAGLSIG